MMRPALLVPLGSTLPAAAMILAAVLPPVGDVARPCVGAFVALLFFACIASLDAAPPTRREAGIALLMAAVPWVTSLFVLAGLAAWQLPPDLALAAALTATAPVALGTAARCRSLGLDARPATWAALSGMVLAPVLMPLAAATQAGPAGLASGLPSPGALVGHALLVGGVPVLLAVVVRHVAPATARRLAPDLRGCCVLALAGLGLCAGGTLARSVNEFTWAGLGLPLVLAFGMQAIAIAVACMAAGFGGRLPWTRRSGIVRTGQGLSSLLLIAATSRNASLAWAAGAGGLTLRAETVLAISLAASFVLPALILACKTRGPADSQHRQMVTRVTAGAVGSADSCSGR